MTRNQIIGSVLLGFALVFGAQYSAIWMATTKTNIVSKFSLSSDRIVKDLDGRAVSLMLNQVWPFDSSQRIDLQLVSKKQVDEYVVAVVDVKALAAVQQVEVPKEQFSTSTTSKDVPKNPPKLPSKLQLNGKMKLTYELVEGEWYLVGVENLNLKAIPLD
jgi:hypothetical protein